MLSNQPSDVEARESFDGIFGPNGRLPAAAQGVHLPLACAAVGQRGTPRRLGRCPSPGWNTLAWPTPPAAFDELSKADTNDAAAAYNLALARAWLGENGPALEMLDRYVTLETDEEKAGDAWALGEVLRCAYGMDEQSDYHEYSVTYQLRDARPHPGRVAGLGPRPPADPAQHRRAGGRLQRSDPGACADVHRHPGASEGGPLAAYLLIAQGVTRLGGPVRERLERARTEFEQKARAGLADGQERVGRPAFSDVVTEAVVFPMGVTDQAEAERRVEAGAQLFFEGTWLQRPLKTLNGIAPIDAAGHAVLRRSCAAWSSSWPTRRGRGAAHLRLRPPAPANSA